MVNSPEMRTRILTEMTNGEAEEYLGRNDIIFLPLGVTETHGGMPLGCETVAAQAFALRMAEAADGLVLPDLSYLYPGSTVTGRGTVSMSITRGVSYLKDICRSLINQGFKRQILLSCHGPAYLTGSTAVREIFEETKIPILYIDMMQPMMKANIGFDKLGDLMYGAYGIMGRLEAVPLNVPESNSVTYDKSKKPAAGFMGPVLGLANMSGSIGYYIGDPWEHMPTPLVKTPGERLERAKRGEKIISDVVNSMDIVTVADTMRLTEKYCAEVIAKHPHLAEQGKIL